MRFTAVLPATLAIGLVMAPTAIAHSGSPQKDHVRAWAAGSDGPPPVLPSLIRTRIERGTKAIERAGDWVDQDDNNKAVVSLRNVRRNMYAAWRGAVDVVENAPPPAPPGDDLSRARVRVRVIARQSSTYLSPEETAVAVLSFQHDVATAAYGLLDGAKGGLRDAVSTTMFAALNRRDQAIVYIHGRPVPPPPPPDLARASAKAHASDDDGPPTFATLMPGIVPDLDDELGQAKGLLRGGALTPGEKRIMGQARAQTLETKDQVSTWWPPVPADD